jgi:ribose 1,5-bisphosphokinase PhnN
MKKEKEVLKKRRERGREKKQTKPNRLQKESESENESSRGGTNTKQTNNKKTFKQNLNFLVFYTSLIMYTFPFPSPIKK